MQQARLPDNLINLRNWNARDMVEYAQELTNALPKGLHTQLRKIFGAFRKLQLDFTKRKFSIDDIVLLKPRLAYAVARKSELEKVCKAIDKAIDKVEDYEDFEVLVNFIEAIVAYYKRKFPKEN